MSYEILKVPSEGSPITVQKGELRVPDHPIVGLIQGDGIGVDITPASVKVWEAAVERAYGGARKIAWMHLEAGEGTMQRLGTPLPEETIQAIREFVVAIKGPLTTPVGGGYRSLNVSLRQALDLYACIRPVKHYEGAPSPMREPGKLDVVILRENTEDVYAGIEWPSGSEEARGVIRFLNERMGTEIDETAGIGVKPMTPFGSKRLVRKAIQWALRDGRRSVTLVHKGNIQKYTEGAFREWGYEVAAEEFAQQTISEAELWDKLQGKQPEGWICIKDRIADVMFQHLLMRPEEFDIIAAPNLNGDYLSDAAAAQVGGIGIAPGANIGDHLALFEATHGSAPKYAGKNIVNPSSLVLSGVMMLDYMGWKEAAGLIEAAFRKTLRQKTVTYDFARNLKGATQVKTSEFAEAIIRNME